MAINNTIEIPLERGRHALQVRSGRSSMENLAATHLVEKADGTGPSDVRDGLAPPHWCSSSQGLSSPHISCWTAFASQRCRRGGSCRFQ
jgi:hypothetical protein